MKTERDPKTQRWLAEAGKHLPALALGLALLASPGRAVAAPISQERVVQAVQTWVRQVTADARADAVVERLEPYQANGVTMAYVVHLAPGGFCLAGADSLVLPVYFYCPKGRYDPKDPDCRAILNEIAQRQVSVQTQVAAKGVFLQTYQAELSRRAGAWEDLAAGKGTTSRAAQPLAHRVPHGGPVPQGGPSAPATMVLPVTSQWNQGPPFADFCPTFPPGSTPSASPLNLTDVGCVATATAQMMYYWKWPNSGVGSGSDTYNYALTPTALTTPLATDPGIPSDFAPYLTWSKGVLRLQVGYDNGSMWSHYTDVTTDTAYQNALAILNGKLTQYHKAYTADFTQPIDWSAMKDTYSWSTDPSPVDNGESQVAYLCYELGVALEMDYGLWGSSAYNSDIPGVLTSHFRYDPAADDVSPFSGPDPNQLVAEIQWLRPCILGGSDASGGGHSWLVYGYNMGTTPWQFEMNYGWQTNLNGWYSFDNIHDGFNHKMDCVTGVAPYKAVGFVGAGSSGNGSPNSPYQNITQAITEAPDNATLILQAGSVNTFSGAPLLINRPLTLKGYQATITKQ